MEEEIVQVKIRMPRALRDKIESASKVSGRTMNTEIASRLSASFSGASMEKADALAAGIATGMLKGIAGAAPAEVASYLEPIVDRISEQARAYFEDPRTAENVYKVHNQRQKEASERAAREGSGQPKKADSETVIDLITALDKSINRKQAPEIAEAKAGKRKHK